MERHRLISVAVACVCLSWGGAAFAYKSAGLRELVETMERERPVVVPAVGTIEVAFSPNGGAEALVLRVIDSAKTDIKALAYSFTSARVVTALSRAAKRGVAVTLVADYKSNITNDRSGKSRAALSVLAEAGCDVRVISAYQSHHDKVLIVDSQTVELGSFNYSDAAARVNSENVLVNWNNPALAKAYMAHFDRNLRQSEPFRARY